MRAARPRNATPLCGRSSCMTRLLVSSAFPSFTPSIVFTFLLPLTCCCALRSHSDFCVAGAEGRHKWTVQHKAQGYCNAAFIRWSMSAMPIVTRLTGCTSLSAAGSTTQASACQVALQNVQHPCVWALLIDNFDNLVELFGSKLGSPWSQHLSGGLERINSNHRRHLSSFKPPHADKFFQSSRIIRGVGHAHARRELAAMIFRSLNGPAQKIQEADLAPSLVRAVRRTWSKSLIINTTFLIHETVARESTTLRWAKRPMLTC